MNRTTRIIAALTLFLIAAILAAIMTHLLNAPIPEAEPEPEVIQNEVQSCLKITCKLA